MIFNCQKSKKEIEGKAHSQSRGRRVSCWVVCFSVWCPSFVAVGVALDVAEPIVAIKSEKSSE